MGTVWGQQGKYFYLTFTTRSTTTVLFCVHLLQLASLCFKSLNGSLPTYLSDLHLYTPSQLLRSSADTWVFRIPSFRTKSSGQCSFSYQAPTTWNKLPASICHTSFVTSFKSSLKPFLFPKTFLFSLPALRCLCTSRCVCVRVCVHAGVSACVCCLCIWIFNHNVNIYIYIYTYMCVLDL